jgi:hypothetical protein|tara:strand:+ start:261 stop:800 length:540 start_codon:yes stop_codon:yes gene_type:complete
MKIKNILIITFVILLIAGQVISQTIQIQANKETSTKKDNTNTVGTSIVPKIKTINEEYFKKELNLSENTTIEKKTLTKLISANQNDEINLKRIIRLARITKQEKREKISQELLSIDKFFLIKFETRLSDNLREQKAKQQLEHYINTIESKKQIQLQIDDTKIKNLFKTENTREFMNSLI